MPLVLLLLALGVAGAWWWWQTLAHAPASPPAAAQAAASAPSLPASYVDNQQCLGCHQEQGRQWQQSHHAQAMAAPTEQTVRGDFNDTAFKHQGVTTGFFKRGDKFMVRTDGPDGKLADFEVSYTFGVAPLQQYLIALPGGRLQPLQIAWDSERKRWFHLLPDEKAPPGDVLHWTGRYQTANTMCIGCHTTGFEKRYDAGSDSFASRWSEPNVSCQSCHGAGERHLHWAQQRQQGRAVPDAAGERYGLSIKVSRPEGAQQVELCSPCHSRRSELADSYRPGEPRLDHFLPSLLTPSLYHADGQQLDEVYVDGSFRQSKMYGKGVGCLSCHDAHTGKLRQTGNAVCLQCHAAQPNPAFPAAAGPYVATTHHFHKTGSAGALCVNCHMPTKTYMQVQARPDHSLRIPRPDLSVKIGTPNACTGCHADKPAQWAADQVARWYGPKRRQETHFGEVFAAARAGEPQADEGLAKLAVDATQPAIVRASALAALRADGRSGAGERIQATRDADPEVRAAAANSLDALSAAQRLYALVPMLSDPVRAVRIAAARGLSSLPREQIEAARRPTYDAALAEYVAAQNVSLDMPGAQLNLAVVYQNTGRLDLAEQRYLQALKIDPDFTPARSNLAQLYGGAARYADAERVLKEGLQRQPAIGELQYSLGLVLAEDKRIEEAAAALATAAKLLPERARVHYNLGLALQQLGRRQPAEAALLQAQKLDPRDPALCYALAVFYAQGRQYAQARAWAEKLLVLDPANAEARQLLAELRTRQ